MNLVKVYDNSGGLKKVISSNELQKWVDMLITNSSQYRKTKDYCLGSSSLISLLFLAVEIF